VADSANTTAPSENPETDDVALSTKPTATHSAATSAKSTSSAAAAPDKTEEAEAPSPAPMIVKGGKAPAAHSKSAAADAPAPSLIGMTASAAPPPDLVTASSNAFKPMLQTMNISQGVSQGLLIKKVSPIYPSNALRMRIEGSVELLATISKDGNITHIKVLSGDSQLTRSATDAVKQWKYKPYLLNGEPVEIQTQITVNFKLPH
jgi:protein TonB